MVGSVDLWDQYIATKDAGLRGRLIAQYVPLVKYVVGRLAINLPAVIEAEDIISYGVIGLMDAVDRFDPSRGIKFETYAISRIRGSIIDALRSLDPVPRSSRQRAREIEQVMTEMEQQLGRPPTTDECAAKMGVSPERFLQWCQRAGVLVLSLDNLLDLDREEASLAPALAQTGDLADPQDVAERHEMIEGLAEALNHLGEKERMVMVLYYHEELTMKEIAKVLDISESRVCQLHGQALLRLRARLTSQAETG